MALNSGKANWGQMLSAAKAAAAKTSDSVWGGLFQKQAPAIATAAASADAVGQDTYAATSTNLKTMDVGPVSITKGTVSATALAQTKDGSTPYTSATTLASASSADVIIQKTTSASGSGADAAGAWSYASSTTRFLSIDIQGVDLTPRIVTKTADATVTTRPASTSGNDARFDVNVAAQGDDTYTDVQTSAISVEDRYSGVTTTTTVAAQTDSILEFFNTLF
jgi:hypothetical protein